MTAKKILLASLLLIVSYSAKCQTSITLPTEKARWYFDQARINIGLKADIVKYKGIISKQEVDHKNTIFHLTQQCTQREALKDSTIADYQKLEVGYIAENKGLRKQVKKQKFLKWLFLAIPTGVLTYSVVK